MPQCRLRLTQVASGEQQQAQEADCVTDLVQHKGTDTFKEFEIKLLPGFCR
jgi:hypothetical protein